MCIRITELLRKMSVLGCVLMLCSLSHAQSRDAAKAKFRSGSSVTIPIDIDNNIIRMKVRINGSRELLMIFDTGASMTLIDEKIVKDVGLTPTNISLKGSGTGGAFGGKYLGETTLSVDGVKVGQQPIAAYPQQAPPGFEFDGVIGYDFIRAFVVEIDYDKKTMALSDPSTYRYRGRGSIVPLNLAGRKTPLVATKLWGATIAVSPDLELDTGFDAAFSLAGRFVAEKRLLRNLPDAAESTAHGAGGAQKRVLVTFLRGSIGRFVFRGPQVFLSLDQTGADNDKTSDGVIGGEILRRFRVILDYSRSRMILEKNSHFDEPIVIEDSE